MAATKVMHREADVFMPSPLVELRKVRIFSFRNGNPDRLLFGENDKSRGLSIEKKIELLESLAGKVTNRRSRRWLNDRLLMELVPRLNAEEIRGLFSLNALCAKLFAVMKTITVQLSDDVPLSAFCITDVGEWDKFRNIDMDKEANIIGALPSPSTKNKFHADSDKMAVLNAWRRIDCRTREALRRSFLSELIASYEDCIRNFIRESGDGGVLTLEVRDPFHRLLLHGVCEFYKLVSVTVTQPKAAGSLKATKIKKKKTGGVEVPSITLSNFLKMSKGGIW